MDWLIGPGTDMWQAAAKASLLFLIAVVGFRFGERRTFAQLAPVDFVVVVSAGAIVGRTATASNTAFLVGVAALTALLITHRLVGRLRRYKTFTAAFDQPILLLIAEGEVQDSELKRTALTLDDLYGILRARGVRRVGDVRFLIYENKGAFSLVTWDQPVEEEPVAAALEQVGRATGTRRSLPET